MAVGPTPCWRNPLPQLPLVGLHVCQCSHGGLSIIPCILSTGPNLDQASREDNAQPARNRNVQGYAAASRCTDRSSEAVDPAEETPRPNVSPEGTVGVRGAGSHVARLKTSASWRSPTVANQNRHR
jgi:hypothetical protein